MFSSLRIRILITTLVVITLALLINSTASYLTVKTHNDQQINQQLSAVSQGHTEAIGTWLSSRTHMMEAARDPVTGDNPVSALKQAGESGGFLSTYLGRPDGSLITSDGWVPPDDYDPRKRTWYKDAVEQGQSIVSLPYIDANSGQMVVTFATPVKRNGRLYGVLGGDVVIDSIIANVAAISPTPSSFAFLSAEDGTLIAHQDSDLILEPSTRLNDQLTAERMESLASRKGEHPLGIAERDTLLSITPIEGSQWMLGVALDKHEATSGLRGIVSASLLTLVVVALASGIFLSLLLKVIFRRLRYVSDAMEGIAGGNGDLTQRLPDEGRDEVAQIATAFNHFVAKMETVMMTIRDSSDSVRTAASEIAHGGQDLSRRTENAASSLQQTSASIEEITSTVEHTAHSAREANELSRQASEVAGRGGKAVGQVVTTMDEITQSSQEISEIITVMNGIAFQTNLLALNASVEAARAGEQGRGFAVVANEVRQLASRSTHAASDIKALIEASGAKVDAGTRLVRDAGKTMQEIVASITQVTAVLGEISSATHEQSDGIQQVNVAVAELDRMTQQNAAMVEESTVAAEQLKEQSLRLADVVGGFTLTERPSPGRLLEMPQTQGM
ncbi:methyl-accepting chemotaxis protein [Vreelandella rituensis]|uniref:Methyl-accepting chemotaxis protein n=1 Tax=Vreelandella rituensis TaxID=2282306 RepID=A0A368U932_9GAMM|nr:methyl-accepting chemotaxis protein [Halomonas rituensis]RCV93465.1 methyl-accepting chemotaxis protein [Halomonas rituensis]